MTATPRAARIPVPETGAALARKIAEAAGGSAVAVLVYGSHLNRARPGRGSAWDLVVVVEEYRRFHRALRAAGEIHRPLLFFDALATILPPNVIAFTPDDGREGMAKCLVVRRDHFERGLSLRARDHFLLGRMIQKVALAWSAGPEAEAWVERCLERAHHTIPVWMAPFVRGRFDLDRFGLRVLQVCYRGEIRPEAGNRSEVIYQAQADHFRAVLSPVLEEAVREGRMERVEEGAGRGGGVEAGVGGAGAEGAGADGAGGAGSGHGGGGGVDPSGGAGSGEGGPVYRYARPATLGERIRWRVHFLRSKVRSTMRWFKHVLTFDNWLPYITRKVERRTGQTVELTRLERRWPVIFLWPRVVRTLLDRPERE